MRLSAGLLASVAIAVLLAGCSGTAVSGWTLQATPSVGDVLLQGISCPSTRMCMAVGLSAVRPVAASWDGSMWKVLSTPNPTPGPPDTLNGALNSVSCISSTACIAVGFDRHGTLAENWNGTQWKVEPTPQLGRSEVAPLGLKSISCTSATACSAVGYVENPSTLRQHPLAERWNGTTWSMQATPTSPGGILDALTSVSCVSSTRCAAVGAYTRNDGEFTLTAIWNGRLWNIQPTRAPSGTPDGPLTDVSCASATSCVAVGLGSDIHGTYGKVEAWNGTVWRFVPSPDIPGANVAFSGVSCISPQACTVVGYEANTSGEATRTFALQWNGKHWAQQRTISPSKGSAGSYLRGVSCTSSTACTTIGDYTNHAGVNVMLAERYSG